MTVSTSPVIQAEGLNWIVGGRYILRDIDIQLWPGEVLGLIGPNGAGKSSLLGLLSGEISAGGSVLLRGREITSYAPKELARLRSVMLQQVDVAFPYLVRDVVEMGRAPWPPGNPAQDGVAVDFALAATDVVYLQDRDITTLSGGERARAALARVLAQDTEVVLLDEPTAALDMAHQVQTMLLCRKLAERGRAVVVVLHDIDLAANYCDRLTLLSGGSVVANGPPGKVCTAERLSAVYRWPIRVLSDPETGELVIRPGTRPHHDATQEQ